MAARDGTGTGDPYLLRHPRPGDMGWMVQRHGAFYHEAFGWGPRFEGLAAEIVGRFLRSHDPARERCWIAEMDGANVGSVFVCARSADVAQLRMLFVEPSARGLGIGRRLVRECTLFARDAGYASIVLWTDPSLAAARRLYEAEGYRLVREEPHEDFGQGLVGQVWEMAL